MTQPNVGEGGKNDFREKYIPLRHFMVIASLAGEIIGGNKQGVIPSAVRLAIGELLYSNSKNWLDEGEKQRETRKIHIFTIKYLSYNSLGLQTTINIHKD